MHFNKLLSLKWPLLEDLDEKFKFASIKEKLCLVCSVYKYPKILLILSVYKYPKILLILLSDMLVIKYYQCKHVGKMQATIPFIEFIKI